MCMQESEYVCTYLSRNILSTSLIQWKLHQQEAFREILEMERRKLSCLYTEKDTESSRKGLRREYRSISACTEIGT